MEISVIVPVYNVEKYLPKCLDSLCAQAECVKEIILINDGSTDNSLGVCQDYEKKDARIKVMNMENKGVMAAIIAGVNEAKYDYLGFVDSDDYIDSNMFSKMSKKVQETNADVVVCDYYREYSDGSLKYQVAIPNSNTDVYEKNYGRFDFQILPSLKHVSCIAPFRWNKLLKKSLMINNYGFQDLEIRVGEDMALVVPIFFSAQKIVYLKEGLYFYRQRENSLVHTYNSLNFVGWKKLVKILDVASKEYSYPFDPNLDDVSLALLMSVCLYKIHISELDPNEKAQEYKVIGNDKDVRFLLTKTKLKTNMVHKMVFLLLKWHWYKLLSILY